MIQWRSEGVIEWSSEVASPLQLGKKIFPKLKMKNDIRKRVSIKAWHSRCKFELTFEKASSGFSIYLFEKSCFYPPEFALSNKRVHSCVILHRVLHKCVILQICVKFYVNVLLDKSHQMTKISKKYLNDSREHANHMIYKQKMFSITQESLKSKARIRNIVLS